MSKKKKAPEKDTSERWLLTYSDLMNLLLILFIILYCMSEVDAAKATAVSESIREGFGYTASQNPQVDGSNMYEYENSNDKVPIFEGGDGQKNSGDSNTQSDTYWNSENDDFKKLYEEIKSLIQENNLGDLVDVSLDNRGVVISFKDNVLFASGRADLDADDRALIDNIGSLLKGLQYSFILVEGHTDTDPIHTSQFVDNTDLSSHRAGNVLRELIANGLAPEKMASIGYGEYRPIATNETSEGKAKNRRVVVTILRADIDAGYLIAGQDAAQTAP